LAVVSFYILEVRKPVGAEPRVFHRPSIVYCLKAAQFLVTAICGLRLILQWTVCLFGIALPGIAWTCGLRIAVKVSSHLKTTSLMAAGI
jgi:hypothetical protein